MRTGRGGTYRARCELRLLHSAIDPILRADRHGARMRLANLQARLAALDTRTGDPAPLLEKIAEATRHLADFDAAVVAAIEARRQK